MTLRSSVSLAVVIITIMASTTPARADYAGCGCHPHRMAPFPAEPGDAGVPGDSFVTPGGDARAATPTQSGDGGVPRDFVVTDAGAAGPHSRNEEAEPAPVRDSALGFGMLALGLFAVSWERRRKG